VHKTDIKHISDNQISISCFNCGAIYMIKIDKTKHKIKVDELGETIALCLGICKKCKASIHLNMGLPDDESDIADQIPDNEWANRHIIKNTRAFLKGSASTISSNIPAKPK